MSNAINWFEIPVTNMDRALKFYNAIFGIQMEAMSVMGSSIGLHWAG